MVRVNCNLSKSLNKIEYFFLGMAFSLIWICGKKDACKLGNQKATGNKRSSNKNSFSPYLPLLWQVQQWTFYSATSILKKCRKVVLEKWFFKLGFFFWSTTFLQPEKMWIYGIKPPFFLVNHFSWTRFLEPLFLNHFSTTF